MTRVLCVDDELPFLEIAKRYLEKIGGFEVDIATSVKGAVDLMKDSSYDAIVSDYQMPDADGIEFLRMLRDAGNEITFILLTGRGREDVAIDALNSGADFYIQKGLDPKSQFHELANMILKAVRAREAEEDIRASEARYRHESAQNQVMAATAKALLAPGSSLESLSRVVIDGALELTESVLGMAANIDPTTGDNIVHTMSGDVEGCNVPGKSLPIILKKGEDGMYPSLWGHPLNVGKGFYTNSPSEHPSASGVPEGHLVLRNFLSVPAKVGSGTVGQIGIANSARDYTDEDISAVGRLADIYSMAIMRRRGEATLAASREEYRILMENMPCIVFRGKATMIDELHGPVEAITGRSREDLLQGRPKWRELVHPDDLELYDERRGFVMAHRTPATFEYRIVHKDGSVHWVSFSVNILVDADDVPTAYGTISDITEDKRRDELIRYQAVLMSNVRDPVLATDMGLGITYMNSAAEEFYGFSLDEIRGRDIHESLRTEFLDASHEEVARHVMESGHHRGRCFQYDKEGNRLSLEFSISSIEDEKGRVVGFVGSGQDISLGLARDRELTKAKEYAESLVDSTNAMFVVLDNDGVVRVFNRAAEEITGRPRSEVIGGDWFENFIPVASRDEVRDEFDMIISGQRPGLSEFENPIVTRDGKERVVAWRSSLLMVEGEVGGVVSFGIDVTELRRSEERFQLLAEHAKDVVMRIVLDPTPRIEYISPSVMTVAGRPPEDFYNIPGLVFDIIHPDDRDMLKGLIESPESIGGPVVMRLFHTDGSLRWIEFQMTPVMGPGGNMVALESVARDVTERMRYESALRQVNKKLNLLGSITRHDILNQLSVLVGWLQIAMESEGGPDALDCLTRCMDATSTIRTQLEFTGDYKRIGMKHPGWLDVEETFRRGQEGLHIGSLEVATDVEGLELFADIMLERVFHNLVSNTISHAGDAHRIVLSHRCEGDILYVVYEDDGRGISWKEKEMLFERGYGKGTGYGLYLAREILSITGSDILETGVEGEGARFEISVPKGNYRFRDP